MDQYIHAATRHVALRIENRTREPALFNLAIDSNPKFIDNEARSNL
jgi:hypothetical protein